LPSPGRTGCTGTPGLALEDGGRELGVGEEGTAGDAQAAKKLSPPSPQVALTGTVMVLLSGGAKVRLRTH